jgi:hypothetical protein
MYSFLQSIAGAFAEVFVRKDAGVGPDIPILKVAKAA